MLYLYGIIDRYEKAVVPAVNGLDDASVRVLSWCDLMVAASDVAEGDVAATEDNLWVHEHVLDALMTRGTVLPMRFGTVVTDEAACLRRLTDLHGSLRADLARLRGCVEFGLRITEPVDAGEETDAGATAEPAAGTGTAYIRERLRAHRRNVAARQRMAEAEEMARSRLDHHAADTKVWPDDPPNPCLRASFLVRKDHVAPFLHVVGGLQRHQPDVRVSCTGPWPPYSFVRTLVAPAAAMEDGHA